jgi:hypothetical protein
MNDEGNSELVPETAVPITKGEERPEVRDRWGRYATGHRGGPGCGTVARHARQIAERFDEAAFKVCAPDRLLGVLDAVMKKAEAGDLPAAEFVRKVCQDRDIPMRIDGLEELANRILGRNVGEGN